MKTDLRTMALIISVVLAGIIGGPEKLIAQNKLSYRVIFTTGLNEENEPIDNVKKISLGQGRIYLYISWNRISNEKHHYLCEIFDGSGQLINSNEMDFTPEKGHWNTWNWYHIKEHVDQLGTWIFKVYLDDENLIEEGLQVDAVQKRTSRSADGNGSI